MAVEPSAARPQTETKQSLSRDMHKFTFPSMYCSLFIVANKNLNLNLNV